jgi:hypothetical protein
MASSLVTALTGENCDYVEMLNSIPLIPIDDTTKARVEIFLKCLVSHVEQPSKKKDLERKFAESTKKRQKKILATATVTRSKGKASAAEKHENSVVDVKIALNESAAAILYNATVVKWYEKTAGPAIVMAAFVDYLGQNKEEWQKKSTNEHRDSSGIDIPSPNTAEDPTNIPEASNRGRGTKDPETLSQSVSTINGDTLPGTIAPVDSVHLQDTSTLNEHEERRSDEGHTLEVSDQDTQRAVKRFRNGSSHSCGRSKS